MVRMYGCTTLLKAVLLQFKLSGYGLKTAIRLSKAGQYVVEAAVKAHEDAAKLEVEAARATPEAYRHA